MEKDKASEDTAKAVQQLMETMSARFQQLSDKIIGRIDEMGNRIDDLERSIAVLMKESEEHKGSQGTAVTASPSGKLVHGPGQRRTSTDQE